MSTHCSSYKFLTTLQQKVNKKFELMLTRCKSSCLQTVSLSPTILSQFILRVGVAAKDRKNQ